MRVSTRFLLGVLSTALAAGCGGSGNNGPDGGNPMNNNVQDAGPGTMGGGTCAAPIDLEARGTTMGMETVFTGSTAGMPNELHPYGGCAMMDAEEMVFSYRVPAGTQALRISTAGSEFDTALYVRTNCSQAMGGTDLACNNDSYDSAPQSTVFLTNVVEGQVLFIVVDGSGDAMSGQTSGSFRLTVTRVERGAEGNPCRPEEANPRCDGMLACSQGGAADGTPICTRPVAPGMMCDQRGFDNTCTGDARCVTDPSPPEGDPNAPTCAMPGTRPGAACRMTEPRCDSPYTCGAGENPVCVRVLSTGQQCDATGQSNACPMGEVCGPLGEGGPAICHAPR